MASNQHTRTGATNTERGNNFCFLCTLCYLVQCAQQCFVIPHNLLAAQKLVGFNNTERCDYVESAVCNSGTQIPDTFQSVHQIERNHGKRIRPGSNLDPSSSGVYSCMFRTRRSLYELESNSAVRAGHSSLGVEPGTDG